MVTRCPYCDFAYPDEPISLDILKIIVEPDLPFEDYMLWMERAVQTRGDKSYSGIKLHISEKHPSEPSYAVYDFNEQEKEFLESHERANVRTV